MTNRFQRYLLVLLFIILPNLSLATPKQLTNHQNYKDTVEFIEELGLEAAIETIVKEQIKYTSKYGNSIDEYTSGLGITGFGNGITQTIQVDIDRLLKDVNKQRESKGKKPLNKKKIFSLFNEGGEYYIEQFTKICTNPSMRGAIDSNIDYVFKYYDQDMMFISESTMNKSTCLKNEDTEISVELSFQEFHDPGYIVTEEGFEYTFGYQGITYENINTWEQGRIIELQYSRTEGVRLFDPKSGAYAYISDCGKHPIDLLESKCLSEKSSTMGISSCLERSFELWSADIEVTYDKIKDYVSRDTYQKINSMHKRWIEYRESRFSVNREVHKNDSGTISIIESANRASSTVRSHALYLESLLSHAKQD